ncbi:hypothetical protein [Pseudoxanthomonas kaohsiungensis]|uniref:hypothetical protein n=1 Tax=Pseudoxanthomonas kaohsiungensis TaxID=283923 RepID=UPI0035ADE4A7
MIKEIEMRNLSEEEAVQVAGGGILGQIDEIYQYAKEAATEFWRGFKEGAGLEEA